MEEIKKQLRQLNAAVFGNAEDPKRQPGILMELAHLDSAIKHATNTLEGLRSDIRKGMWIIVGAVLTAIVASVLKG